MRNSLKGVINMKFPNPQMEEEYSSIKNLNNSKDLKVSTTVFFLCLRNKQVAVAFLILLNIFMIIYSLITTELLNCYLSIAQGVFTIGILALSLRYKRYISDFLLLLLIMFSVVRVIMFVLTYSTLTRGTLMIYGYGISTIHITLIYRIPRLRSKIGVIVFSFAVRFGVIMGFLDTASFSPITIIRNFIIDFFLAYTFYSKEEADRRVFKKYYDKREELIKFKELLADSLPQSVTIRDCESHNLLFSNNAFLNTFHEHSTKDRAECTTESDIIVRINQEAMKPDMEQLLVDTTTIREVGATEATVSTPAFGGTMLKLEDVLWTLVEERKLEAKVLCLTASHMYQNQTRWFEVIMKRVKWDNAEAVAIILNDITYQKNIIALKVANTNKDKIIATVSHELRTPLHVMLGLLEATEKEVENPEALRAISLCKDNANLLWSFVSSILDFHQISTGKLNLNLMSVSLRQVLEDVRKLFAFQCQQKKILLELEVSEDIPSHIITDSNRLKQILVNLLGNATKFTFSGGIKIKAKQDTEDIDSVIISVSDTGIGIKEEDKHKLFKMYTKPEGEDSVNKNGVGLGLTISNALALILGGNTQGKGIGLKSRLGFGSTFYFKILKDASGCIRLNSRSEISLENRPSDYGVARNSRPGSREKNIVVKESDRNLIGKEDGPEEHSSCCYDSESPIDVESKLSSYGYLRMRNPLDQQQRFVDQGLSISKKQSIGRSDSESFICQAAVQLDGEKDIELKKEGELEQIDEITDTELADKGCVLVVDDNSFNLLIAGNFLKNLGYSVKTAMGGQEAIELIKSLNVKGYYIKGILMDCQMPVMDGYETTRIIRGMMDREEIQKVPILAWTANNSKEDIDRCYEYGMVGHIPKPTSQEALGKALKEAKVTPE